VAAGLIVCLPPVTVGLEGDYHFAPSIISLTHILWFSPPSMHSLLQWKKRRRCRHQRPNQIILHSVWLRSPCPRREGCPAVIQAGQQTYSNGEMNQATSESVIHGDRRARKQEEKTRSEIGTGRRKQTRLGIKQDKKQDLRIKTR
jgi:hypothetical protein